jgi:hypothetical protein
MKLLALPLKTSQSNVLMNLSINIVITIHLGQDFIRYQINNCTNYAMVGEYAVVPFLVKLPSTTHITSQRTKVGRILIRKSTWNI